MDFIDGLAGESLYIVRQRTELAEMLGFEARNKYEILRRDGQPLCYAAEQQKGLGGMVMRQLLGHFRTFDVQIFTPDRRPVLKAHHPFRWLFQRLEVEDGSGRRLGALQQRFAVFSKRFDLEDGSGQVVATVSSPLWRPWTFSFQREGREVAVIRKRWSGALKELITDADNFVVEVLDPTLPPEHRALLLCGAIFVDLQYFEKKAGHSERLLGE